MIDEELIKELYPTTPLADIAELTGASPFKIMMLANKLGLKREEAPRHQTTKKPKAHKPGREERKIIKEKREELKAREEFRRNIVNNVDNDVKWLFSRHWAGSEPHQPCTWFLGADV